MMYARQQQQQQAPGPPPSSVAAVSSGAHHGGHAAHVSSSVSATVHAPSSLPAASYGGGVMGIPATANTPGITQLNAILLLGILYLTQSLTNYTVKKKLIIV